MLRRVIAVGVAALLGLGTVAARTGYARGRTLFAHGILSANASCGVPQTVSNAHVLDDALRDVSPFIDTSTYLGGHLRDEITVTCVDDRGFVYIGGFTSSGDFPVLGSAHLPSDANYDAFVTKLDPTAAAVIYSVVIGGSGTDQLTGMAVDQAGAVYLVGTTDSTDFPLVNPIQSVNNDYDLFVGKLSPEGSGLEYSTYFGGPGYDTSSSAAVNAQGELALVAFTLSTSFPISNADQTDPDGAGNLDAIVAKFNSSGTALVFSTYAGGQGDENGKGGITYDAVGNLWVTYSTFATNVRTTAGVVQPEFGGGFIKAVVAKYSNIGDLLIATYLGGSQGETGNAIAVDSSSTVYVTGTTSSSDFPTANPAQPALAGYSDAFLVRLNSSCNEMLYGTYLGGSDFDEPAAVAVDKSGQIAIAGLTKSLDFPAVHALQSDQDGPDLYGNDAFVAALLPDGSAPVFATYYGGSGQDAARSVTFDPAGRIVVGGITTSLNLPIANSHQTSSNDDGGLQDRIGDGFFARFGLPTSGDAGNVALDFRGLTPNPVPSGSHSIWELYLENLGPGPVSGAVFRVTIPPGVGFESAELSQGTVAGPVQGGSGDLVCAVGELAPGNYAVIAVDVLVSAEPGSHVVLRGTASSVSPDVDPLNNAAVTEFDVIAKQSMPVISEIRAVTGAGKPFRIKISGSTFQAGSLVFVGEDVTSWPSIGRKGESQLTLRQGSPLKARFPRGKAIRIKVVNPDGGMAEASFTR